MTGHVNSAAGMDEQFQINRPWLTGDQYYQVTSNSGEGVGRKVYPWVVPQALKKGVYMIEYYGSVGNPAEGWYDTGVDGAELFNYSNIEALTGTVNVPFNAHGYRAAGWGGMRWGNLFEVTSNKATIRVQQSFGNALVTNFRKYNLAIVITRLSR